MAPAKADAGWIRAQRQALDWSQARLAEELEVDVGSVSRWERGEIAVDRRTQLAVERLAELHGSEREAGQDREKKPAAKRRR